MGIYALLASAYDDLFPQPPAATTFLDALRPRDGARRRALLDAGCATGSQALALAALGWRALGVDSEESMIRVARAKAASLGLAGEASFEAADMLDLIGTLPAGGLDLVACLGNTLPHLGPGGAAAFLAEASRVLAPGGALVVQALNYARPGVGPGFAFPELRAAGAVLRRRYESPPEGESGALAFRVELELGKSAPLAESMILWPLAPSDLASLLGAAGFGAPSLHSGWEGGGFREALDPFVVAVARSGR
jgi:glycine/sarcosine N-methyltransferase